MNPASFQHLRVAVIGFGSIGKRHFDNLASLGVTRRVVVRRAAQANMAFTVPDDARVVHSVQDAIATGLDLAVICNPTSLHCPVAAEFIQAGIPVLVEKPLAATLQAAHALLDETQQHGSLAGVAYPLRYHPGYIAARQALLATAIGQVLSAHAWFHSYLPDWHPWEDYRVSYAARPELGGGVLPTLDHELDFLNWCLGTPQHASGSTQQSGQLAGNFDDVANLQVQYPKSVAANIELSLNARDRQRGFTFTGTLGALHFDWNDQRLTETDQQGNEHILWQMRDYPVNDMYLALLQDMLMAVATGARQAPVPLASGCETLWIVQQIGHRA